MQQLLARELRRCQPLIRGLRPFSLSQFMSTEQKSNSGGITSQVVDRARFDRVVQLQAVRVAARDCSKLSKELLAHGLLFHSPVRSVKYIINDKEDRAKKLVILRQDAPVADVEPLVATYKGELVPHEHHFTYDSYDADYVLKELLSTELKEIPSGFAQTGHIAHLNLRDEQLPFKHIIGQVLLDKAASIRTVVNKIGTIANEYRVFNMEVIAGVPDFVTTLKEHNCTFRFDFSKVYWNSRLQTEHQRGVQDMRKGQVVVDMMCGVGPFAVPAAKKGCRVWANDKNPESYRWLVENRKVNKISPQQLQCFNMDARAFIRENVYPLVASGKLPRVDHVLMNLPASAIEFLDTFSEAPPQFQPMIHCYCFSAEKDALADITQRVQRAFGREAEGLSIRFVRNVAPKKDMYCVNFRVMPQGSSGEPSTKKQKTTN